MKTSCLPKIVLTLCALLFCGAFATPSRAATFTVSNTGDNGGVNPAPGAGTGTLRQAIVDANATAGADTITFAAVTGTILLESVLPSLADDVIISGPGANVLTVKRDSSAAPFRIFAVSSGKTVTIASLTITNGVEDIPGGGGILNNGTLNVSLCTVSGNTAGVLGGGVKNAGTLTLTNSTVSGNSAFSSGGIDNQGTLNVTNSTVSGNSATGHGGGGITSNSGTVNITNSTVKRQLG